MAEVQLDTTQYRTLIKYLSIYGGLETVSKRHNFFYNTGLSELVPELLPTIPLDGATIEFCHALISVLQIRGTLPQTQEPALIVVLRYLRDVASGQEEVVKFLNLLLEPYQITIRKTEGLKLFISYRRKSWAFTQRLADELGERLNANIFVDFTGIDEPDFAKSILTHLYASDAVLLIVTEYTFSDRINEENDWVRREISESLRLKKPIILIAVDGLYPPPAHQLPKEIADIGRMQGIPFYPEPELWDGAVRRLVSFLSKVMGSTPIVQSAEISSSKSSILSLEHLFSNAIDLLDNNEWDRAIVILQDLIAQNYTPGLINIEILLSDATNYRNKEIRRREMMDAYKVIELLAKRKGEFIREQARKEWKKFMENYPDFDFKLGANEVLALGGELKQPKNTELLENTHSSHRTILALFSSPVDLPELPHLNREMERFQDILSYSPKFLYAVSLPSLIALRRELENRPPNIFHFSGHAGGDGIYLEDELKHAQLVSWGALGRMLSNYRDSLEAIVLSGCKTFDQGFIEMLGTPHPTIIATSQPITDTVALQFTIAFYEYLVKGNDIKVAFAKAHAGLALSNDEAEINFKILPSI